MSASPQTAWNSLLSVAQKEREREREPQTWPTDVTQVHCSIYNVTFNLMSGVMEDSVKKYGGGNVKGFGNTFSTDTHGQLFHQIALNISGRA